MAAGRIKGITVEIGGDTTKLQSTAFNTTSSSSSSESNSNLAIVLTPQSIAQNILQDIFLFHKFLVPHLLLHIDNAMAHSLSL